MEEDQKKQNASRRRALKVVAGAGLISTEASAWESRKWVKPVIESVVLPGHAQTTPGTAEGQFSGSVQASAIAYAPSDPGWLDQAVTKAHAGIASPSVPTDLCFDVNSGAVVATVLVNNSFLWQGIGTLGASFSLSLLETGKVKKSNCENEDVKVEVNVKGVPPARKAYGKVSYGFGGTSGKKKAAKFDPPLPAFAATYEVPETPGPCDLETGTPILTCDVED